MRTSLNEIALVEAYLKNGLTVEQRAAIEARMQTDFVFRMNVFAQRKVYSLLKKYFRTKVRHTAESVHVKLFNDPSNAAYRNEVFHLFKKS